LEAASSGYGKEISCVLSGKASEEMMKKVEKSIEGKRRKKTVTRKVSTTD
jgi:hypothetical protein